MYVYFDNDVKVRAPFDAMGLARRVGLEWKPVTAVPSVEAIAEEARSSWPAVRKPAARAEHRDTPRAALRTH